MSMRLEAVLTDGAPRPIGPYSQAVICDSMVFCSGQIGLDPVSGNMVGGDAARQADRAILNLKSVIEQAGASLSTVVKTTLYLVDMGDFQAVNEVYARHFAEARPARSTVAVSSLPKGARVEIDAVAAVRRVK